MPAAGERATRSSSPRPTSIRGRRRGAPSPPSAATRSRSTAPLEYMHFGEITFGVDERGEVGLLTRNIRIQASDDAESSYFGGHIMAMSGSQDACLRRRADSHGAAPDAGPLPDALAPDRRRPGAVHPQLVDPRHLQPLRDGARHQQRAGGEQRHLQHRRPLLLPRRRDRDRQPVRPQPRHPDQVPSDPAVRADQPYAALISPRRARIPSIS